MEIQTEPLQQFKKITYLTIPTEKEVSHAWDILMPMTLSRELDLDGSYLAG